LNLPVFNSPAPDNPLAPEIAAILPGLDDADPARRRVALLQIAEFADDYPQLFIAASRDADAGVRLEAARALEGNAHPAALAALLVLLDDIDAEVAVAARDALAEVRDPGAGQMLLEWLDKGRDEASAARLSALLAALRKLRLPGVLAPALALLEHPAPTVRREAVGALAYLRDPAALPALTARLRGDADPVVRRAAAGALVFAPDDATGKILPALSGALADADWQVREEATVTLGKLSHPATLDSLLRALADPAWEVRLKAAHALGRLRDIAAVPALSAALTHPVSNLRKEAAAALGAIGSPDATAVLDIAARHDTDIEVRKTAARALDAIRQA
jgi:HEAT repeat protein